MLYIYAVSDATGMTAEGVVRAALSQFEGSEVFVERRGGVRNVDQVRQIVGEASIKGAIIVHTLVTAELRRRILADGRTANVATIDLMGPLLVRLADALNIQPVSQPGLFHPYGSSYMDRVDAIDFTVRHDDGKNVDDIEKAEIVLVGVSRTSKTPLSIYLAYRGWRVANIPLILGIEPPPLLFKLPRRRVVGLIVKPDRLVELRQARVEHLGTPARGYADLEYVQKEIAEAYEIYERGGWPLVNVTAKPIEETAEEVIALVGHSNPSLT